MKKVKQLKQRIDHYKGHGVKEGEKAGKYKSSAERNRVNHRKNKSRKKHQPHQITEQKKLIIKTHSQPRSTVDKNSLDKHDSDIFGRFEREDYFGDLGYKYRRGHRDAPKRKNSKMKVLQQRKNNKKKAIHRGKSSKEKTLHQRKKSNSGGKKKQSRARKHKMAQQKSKNKNDEKKKEVSKAKNHKMTQIKRKAKKKLKPNANKHKTMHQKSKQKGGQKSHQIKKSETRKHTSSSEKKSHKLVKNKKRKQQTLQSAKGQRSRQQTIKPKRLSLLIKNIKKTKKKLSNLKKQLNTVNQKTTKSKTQVEGNTTPKDKTKLRGQESRKGGTQVRGRKPSNGKPRVQSQHSFKGKTPARKPYTPDITPSKNVKTKTESIAPAKAASSQKLVEMQRLEKENTALSESVCKFFVVNLLFVFCLPIYICPTQCSISICIADGGLLQRILFKVVHP